MKKLFFAAIAATILFTSCEKGSEVQPEPLGETAKLTIGITSPETVRAVGQDVPDDLKVKNFKVFVVDGDNSIKSEYSGDIPESTDYKNVEVSIQVTTSAKKVYVIANAGDLSAFDLDTEKKINDCIVDLNSNGSQTTARWATGEIGLSAEEFTLNKENEFVAKKEVILKFIAARIVLKINKEKDMAEYYDNGTTNSKDLKITGVHILNARGASKLFGESLVATPTILTNTFYEGLANNAFAFYPTDNYNDKVNFLNDLIPEGDNKDTDYNLNNSTYYYYVFENNADKKELFPTIVTIAGTYDNKPIYFPVHLAKYEKFSKDKDDFGESLTRGKSYEITITLTGDPRYDQGGTYPGKTGGVVDPTNPAVYANVIITIKITPWTVVSLGKTF